MRYGQFAKITYIAVGGLFVLIIAASVIASVMDWNQYRPALAEQVSNRLGMRVELGGKLGLKVLPRPSIFAEAVRISPPGASVGDAVATADRIDMQLGLSALLSGKVEVAMLNLDGLGLVVEEREGGSWQVKGWPQEAEKDASESQPSSVQLNSLHVTGGHITILPLNSDVRILEGLALQLAGTLPSGPLEWDGSFITSGEKIALAGRMRPVPSGEGMAFKTDAVIAATNITVAGRLGDQESSGRLQIRGADLNQFVAASQKLVTMQQGVAAVPSVPFQVDTQFELAGDVLKAMSRNITVGDTHGRLDVTLAQKQQQWHIAGGLSLGIVDIEPWLKAVEASPAATPAKPSEPVTLPFKGALDISVEGVKLEGGLVQQLDATVGFASDGIYLNRLQGLMPGGSNVAFSGKLGLSHGGQGKLRFSSGNLQEVLLLAGLDVTGSVQPGRLATADISADVKLTETAWQVSNVTGQVDTMAVAASFSGGLASDTPIKASLQVDQFNLDAYMVESKASPPQKFALPAIALGFDAKADAMFWRGKKYQNLHIKGRMDAKSLTLSKAFVSQNGGTVSASGSLKEQGKDWLVDAKATMEGWGLPVVRTASSDYTPYLKALGTDKLDGELTATGPLSDMRFSARVSQKNADLTASGSVSVQERGLDRYTVQGTFSHDNMARLARLMGLADAQAIDAALTFSAEAASPQQKTAFRVSGRVAGGQLIADGSVAGDEMQVQAAYDHATARQAVKRFGLTMIQMPAPKEPIRAQVRASLKDEVWTVQTLKLSNGPLSVDGHMLVKADQSFDGKLTIAGYQHAFAGDKVAANEPTDADPQIIPDTLGDLNGELALSFDNIMFSGQRLQAPNAKFSVTKGNVSLQLGNGAQVNGAPADASLAITGAGKPNLTGTFKADQLDLAAFLKAEGYAPIASAQTKVNFSFETVGKTQSALLKALKGRGEMHGKVGVLKFLSVPKLMQSMSEAKSSTAFLSTIGETLRGGQTSFNSLDAAFTVDNGIALMETLQAKGGWGLFALDGQLNFLNQLIDVKGGLDLTDPQDAPRIPVAYSGSLTGPTANWQSRALEKFVIAGLERKLRSSLFKDLAGKEKVGNENPWAAVFSRAIGLLSGLKKAQDQKEHEANKAK